MLRQLCVLLLLLGVSKAAARHEDVSVKMLVDLRPGPVSSRFRPMAVVKDLMFFSATDGIHGEELFLTDGTASNTRLVADINEGSNSSRPEYGMDINGNLVFLAEDAERRKDLWRADTTGAQLIDRYDSWPGVESPGVSALDKQFAKARNHMYFVAHELGNTSRHLWRHVWRTDGDTVEQVQELAGLGMNQMIAVEGLDQVLFVEGLGSNHCPHLWTLEGLYLDVCADLNYAPPNKDKRRSLEAELAGSGPDLGSFTVRGHCIFTVSVTQEIDPGFKGSYSVGNTTVWSTDLQNKQSAQPILQFPVTDGHYIQAAPLGPDKLLLLNKGSIWTTDGTENGTVFVKDLYPYDIRKEIWGWGELTPIRDDLVLIHFQDGIEGGKGDIFATDGTAEGTHRLVHLDNIQKFGFVQKMGDRAVFTTIVPEDSSSFFEYSIWVTDGTVDGTITVATFRVPKSALIELHEWNGHEPMDWIPVPSDPLFLREGVLLFPGYDDQHGFEPWMMMYGLQQQDRGVVPSSRFAVVLGVVILLVFVGRVFHRPCCYRVRQRLAAHGYHQIPPKLAPCESSESQVVEMNDLTGSDTSSSW